VARVTGTLNGLERVLMNNPIRAAIQRHMEARWLLDMGGPMAGGHALEVGCGRGVGVEIIFDVFGAERVDAFDLDVAMVRRAQRRLAHRGGRVRLWIGDATRITADDAAYDAVFDFGILHHVPDWRTAVAELYRVLKPGGRLYAEEMLAGLILNPLVRRLVDHPAEDRFDCATFPRPSRRHSTRSDSSCSPAGTTSERRGSRRAREICPAARAK